MSRVNEAIDAVYSICILRQDAENRMRSVNSELIDEQLIVNSAGEGRPKGHRVLVRCRHLELPYSMHELITP